MLKDSEVTRALGEMASVLLKEMLPSGLGARREFDCEGKPYVAVLEKHTYYGADPSKPHKVHLGVTLYHGESATVGPHGVVTLPDVTIYGTVPSSSGSSHLVNDTAGKRTILAVPGIRKTTTEFRRALCEMCDRLGANPDHVATVMSLESGATFDPAMRNAAGSSAVGLIQFMASTAKALGTTTAALGAMSAVEQLKWVEKYFRPYKGKLTTLERCYLAVFMPALMSKPMDHVVARYHDPKTYEANREPHESKLYRQNKGFDRAKRGWYTVGDICATIRKVEARAKDERIAVDGE